METIKLTLRIIGYFFFGLFFIQILNLYINLLESSELLFKLSFVGGCTALFALVLLDKITNKEDRYYSKNVKRIIMLITTKETLEEFRVIKTLEFVHGSTIRSRYIGNDIVAALKNIVGGEVHEYTKMFAESREQALDRMKSEAELLRANGIVCMRFATSTIMSGMTEFLAYGTAVIIEPRSTHN